MKPTSILSVVVALTLMSAPAPADVRAQAPGVIEGTVSVRGAVRKTASRYPAGGPSVNGMQEVPAVVYLVGDGLGDGASSAPVEVVQRDTAFAPAAIAVQTGTVVSFPNADPFFHNVFSYSRNARFDLGRFPEGDSREYAFEEPGIARVYCEVHEFMRAVILVTDHTYHAVVDDFGGFRIEGVPPGVYTIVAYQPDAGSVEEQVQVSSGTVASVRLDLGG